MIVRGAGRNAKFARFTGDERCAHFLGVLSLAAGAPIRGALLVGDDEAGVPEIALEAGVSEKVAASALAKLKARGVLIRDEELGAWVVHDWGEVNPEPKKDPGNADRQRRYRERRSALLRNDRVTGITALQAHG